MIKRSYKEYEKAIEEGVELLDFDWEEDVNVVVEDIDEVLGDFGLEIETFNTEGDNFAYRIVKKSKD